MKSCCEFTSKKEVSFRPIATLFKLLIWIYQYTLSPFLGPCCRFYPSCSNYALLCLDKYYWPKALAKIATRVLKCNPFHPGGEDLP